VTGSFAGRTVLVTGAAHGFGRAIAHAFSGAGGTVWACDVVAEGLAETARTAPGTCNVSTADISHRAAVQALVAAAGSIDILVNNAGGVRGQVGRPVEEVSEADWRAILDVNLTGAFLCSQAVVPGMKRQCWGRIVNISSGAGLGVSLTGIQAYASAKAGQIGLTRQLAHELGPFGITVNNVAPGFVRSNPTTERQWEAMGEAGQTALVESLATRRLGSPEDIAHATLLFAAEASGWITGQTLSVDGGRIYR
jgi:3-oxoacyl-[acyl-carrier protein] reductase